MDLFPEEIVTMILCDHLFCFSGGGALSTLTTCRLVCKKWKKCIEEWPRYKHIKPLFDQVKRARDDKRVTIKDVSEMGNPLLAELCFNFLKKIKRIDAGTMLNFSGSQSQLVYKCLSLCTGLTSVMVFNVTVPSLTFFRFCTKIRTLHVEKALKLETLTGLENCNQLRSVTVLQCPRLVSLSAINTSRLETLYVSHCNAAGDITFLLGTRHLKNCAILHTKVNGKQLLSVFQHICKIKKK